MERMGCSGCVDSGSDGSVDTGAAVGAVARLLFSCVGVLVRDIVVESQLTRNRIIINPVKSNFIDRNMLNSFLVL